MSLGNNKITLTIFVLILLNSVILAEDKIISSPLINLEKIIPDEKKPRTIEIKTPKKMLGKK